MKPKALTISTTDVRSFDSVRGLALVPELGIVVALCWGGELKGWSLRDGKPVFALDGADTLNRLEVVGRRAVTWGAQNRAPHLWSLEGRTSKRLSDHVGGVACVRFNDRGTLLATASNKGKVFVWDVDSGKRVTEFSCGTTAQDLWFTPDGSHLLARGMELLAVWNLRTRKIERRVKIGAFEMGPSTSALRPDGKILAIGGDTSTLYLVDWASGKVTAKIETDETTCIRAMGFLPGTDRLVVWWDAWVKIWSSKTKQWVDTDVSQRMVVGRRDELVVPRDGHIEVIDVALQRRALHKVRRDVILVAASPEGLIAYATGDARLHVLPVGELPESKPSSATPVPKQPAARRVKTASRTAKRPLTTYGELVSVATGKVRGLNETEREIAQILVEDHDDELEDSDLAERLGELRLHLASDSRLQPAFAKFMKKWERDNPGALPAE